MTPDVRDGLEWWIVLAGALWGALCVIVVWLTIWLVRGVRADASSERKAVEIARIRSASGEIDRGEYERIRSDLAA